MDYEKKYKEALRKARQLCAYPTTKPFINDLQDLFPELKESKDEKTRKRIIALVNAHGQGMYKDDMLTWLEKQCEQSSLNINRECLKGIKRVQEYQDLSDWEKEFDNIASMYAHNKNQEGYNDSWYVKERAAEMLYYAKKELEEQGEQNPIFDFKAKDWYVSKVDGKIYNAKFMKKNSTNLARKLEIEKAAMSATGIIDREEWFIKGAEWADENPAYISSEKQGGQKPTDEVGPITQSYIIPNGKFFQWIYDRLVHVHNENPNVDYMLSLKKRIEDMQNPANDDMKEALQTEYEKGIADAIAEIQKSAWSCEDETRLQACLDILQANSLMGTVDTVMTNWLKSLKQRIGE